MSAAIGGERHQWRSFIEEAWDIRHACDRRSVSVAFCFIEEVNRELVRRLSCALSVVFAVASWKFAGVVHRARPQAVISGIRRCFMEDPRAI